MVGRFETRGQCCIYWGKDDKGICHALVRVKGIQTDQATQQRARISNKAARILHVIAGWPFSASVLHGRPEDATEAALV